jgi:hypothetical protein
MAKSKRKTKGRAGRDKPATRTRLRPTFRDLAILDALVLRTRVLSLTQVERWFWCGQADRSTVSRRLRQLAECELVTPVDVLAAGIEDRAEPLLAWQVGQPEPDWRAIVQQTRARWNGPVLSQRCIVATPAAAARFGVTAHPPRLSEGTHDLHVAQVYLRMSVRAPERARKWVGEAAYGRHEDPAAKVPDAIIQLAGRPLAIEIVGTSYSAEKLSAFHGYCESKRMDYELW